jgi:hypothetical protein
MLRQGSHYPQTDWNELPLHWCHLGVPSGASKWFPSLWYVWRKQCTYLAPRPTLSPNRPKQASTSHTLARSTIRCAQKPFTCPWYIQHKPCTYLAHRLTLSPNGPKQASTWWHHPGLPSGVPKLISMPVVHSAQSVHLCRAKIKTISKWSEMSFHWT